MTSWMSNQEPQFLEQFLFACIKVTVRAYIFISFSFRYFQYTLDSEDTGKESGSPALVTLSLRTLTDISDDDIIRRKTPCYTDGHTIHNSVASIHPDGMAGCGGCWEGKGTEQQCHVHTRPSGHAPVGRSPAVSAGDNTLHTGERGGEATPRMGLEGPRRLSKRGDSFLAGHLQ